MAYHVRKDTLSAYKARAMFQLRNVGMIPMKETCKQLQNYMHSNPGMGVPETEALTFYLLNHAYAELQMKFDVNEPLGYYEWIAKTYTDSGVKIMQRLFYYILVIVTREMRHLGGKDISVLLTDAVGKEVADKFIPFAQKLPVDSSAAMGWLCKNAPDLTISEYLNCMVIGFNKGWWGVGYGGKSWGKIADTAYQCVIGKISPEVMMDVAWALAHNNGPMFNKGMLYQTYNGKALLKILDVQRSGQIPALISEDKNLIGNNATVKEMTTKCCELLPSLNGAGYVDWVKVNKDGAVGSYSDETKHQIKIHGDPLVTPEMIEKKKIKNAQKFYVGPNEYVKTYQRKVA